MRLEIDLWSDHLVVAAQGTQGKVFPNCGGVINLEFGLVDWDLSFCKFSGTALSGKTKHLLPMIG